MDQSRTYEGYGYSAQSQTNPSPAFAPGNNQQAITPHSRTMNPTARSFRGNPRHHPQNQLDSRHRHNQTIQRELLTNFQVARTSVKDLEVEIEATRVDADAEDKDKIYAKEAKLEVLKASLAAFGKMYEEMGEEIEEEWAEVYKENGSIRR